MKHLDTHTIEECPDRKQGLNGDADNSYSCSRTGKPDADGRGWGYDPCNCTLKDYRFCERRKSGRQE